LIRGSRDGGGWGRGGGGGGGVAGRALRKGSGPKCIAYFCLPQYCHYMSSVQIEAFRISPSHPANEIQSF
jgi:hypothetical protein